MLYKHESFFCFRIRPVPLRLQAARLCPDREETARAGTPAAGDV